MVAESVTEMMMPDLDTLNARLNAGEDPKVIQREIERIADMSRLAAASAALVTHQDVPTAIHTATNAVENDPPKAGRYNHNNHREDVSSKAVANHAVVVDDSEFIDDEDCDMLSPRALAQDDSDQGYNPTAPSSVTDTDSVAFVAIDDLFYQRLQQDPLRDHLDRHQGLVNTLAEIQDNAPDQNDFNARLSQAMTENGYDRLRHLPVAITAVDRAMAHNLYERILLDQETQQKPRPRSGSVPDAWHDPAHMLGRIIAEDPKKALENTLAIASEAINFIPIVGSLKQGVLGEIEPYEATIGMATDLLPHKTVKNIEHIATRVKNYVGKMVLTPMNKPKRFRSFSLGDISHANDNHLLKPINNNRPLANDNKITLFPKKQEVVGQQPLFTQGSNISGASRIQASSSIAHQPTRLKASTSQASSTTSTTSSTHVDVTQKNTITIEYKEGMDVRDFDRKTKALQDLAERGKLVKTQPVRDPRVTERYRENILDAAQDKFGQSNPEMLNKMKENIRNMDADHLHELQLGGSDHQGMLTMLEKKVNRSIGSQVRHQMKDLSVGTKIDEVIIKGPRP